jgi:hypothetical protein
MRHSVNRVVDDIFNQRLTIPTDVAVTTRRRRFLVGWLLLRQLERRTDGSLSRKQLSIIVTHTQKKKTNQKIRAGPIETVKIKNKSVANGLSSSDFVIR